MFQFMGIAEIVFRKTSVKRAFVGNVPAVELAREIGRTESLHAASWVTSRRGPDSPRRGHRRALGDAPNSLVMTSSGCHPEVVVEADRPRTQRSSPGRYRRWKAQGAVGARRPSH